MNIWYNNRYYRYNKAKQNEGTRTFNNETKRVALLQWLPNSWVSIIMQWTNMMPGWRVCCRTLTGENRTILWESGYKVLKNMRHRGAEGAMKQKQETAQVSCPDSHEFILLQGIPVPEKGKYGTGFDFSPQNEEDRATILEYYTTRRLEKKD